MYRQVMVHQEDRKHQCIVWSPANSQEASTYQLNTVTYGLSCAPYLALRVLQQLAEDEGEKFPLGAEVVKRHTYVDDLLGGADSVELAAETARQVDGLLGAGGFLLKKWIANEEAVLNAIEEDRRLSVPKTFDDQEVLRALGLKWNHPADAFVLTFNHEDIAGTPYTKRSVLSVVARLYDPLGWLAPVVVTAKIFLQSLWKLDLAWDTPIPKSLASQWTTFAAALNKSTSFSIPRWVGTFQSSSVELHGFSDASRAALAAVVYIRVVEEDFTAQVKLLTSKTRVAPLKNVSIARLELSAAVLLAQLVTKVRQCLCFENMPVHLWSDSSVALYWIQGEPSRWMEFVGNRVAYIKEIVPGGKWHHVAGSDNPADAASRGLLPSQLAELPSWWTGPDWLESPSTSWPNSSPSLPEDVQLEERPLVVLATTSAPEVWDLILRYSKLERLLSVTARLFDAVSRFRRLQPRVENIEILPPALLDTALKFWIGITQKAYFGSDMTNLQSGGTLPRASQLIRLTPFLDPDGLMRVGGRLQRSSLDLDFKHPYILPRSSSLSALLIDQAHRKTFHGGTQLTLNTLRQRFWIVGGRAPARSRILGCVPCARQRGKLAQQQMGQLPSLRTTPARPFLNTGVDYAGPYTLKTWTGRTPKHYKAYLIVFICLVTSAVHLELATDYSTTGFLTAFRRFTSRRGLCASITSDNGTNFVGADAELKKMFTQASEEFVHLRRLLATERVEWHFNPPSAPHFGGKWEAAVKSVKFHLRRVVGETILTYEDFSAFLAQIEAILNSRPLCPLSDDPSDPAALTPGHFLIGDALNAIPEPSLSHIPSSRTSMFQKSRQMVEHFWRRWSREYLQRFQTTEKWLLPQSNLKVGALVLVADERFPPSRWPLARIVGTHPGADGLVRVVSVKTAAGSVLKCPVTRLCLLPVK